jgi:hypothetical protein
MNWNCTNTEEHLTEYLDGQIEPGISAALASHLAECGACSGLMRQVQYVVREMRELEPVPEPPQLIARILGATVGTKPRPEGWRRWFSWIPALWTPRFAMGAATVAASFVIVLHTAGVRPSHLKKASLNPLDAVRSANRQAHLMYARGSKFVNDLRIVYEIQSRMEPEPPIQTMPLQEPEKKPESDDGDSPQKSQANPHHNRSEIRNPYLFAEHTRPSNTLLNSRSS